MSEIEKMRDALRSIGELARNATDDRGGASSVPDNKTAPPGTPGCAIKALPRRLWLKAARNAIRVSPTNAPQRAPIGADGLGVTDPLRIAVMTTKYWGPQPRQLTVSFVGSASSASSSLRARILSHMNAWSKTGCISFTETSGTGQVRIAFDQTGHWSYLGIDILSIPMNRPTMNLQEFDRETRDAEFYRVVRHETGHTLGFPHEHMRKELVARIDRQKANQYFWATQGWDAAMVEAQVLTPLSDDSLYRTPPDQTSIMCYQLPASITVDNLPITGGVDINETDYAFNGLIYPRQNAQSLTAGVTPSSFGAAPAAMTSAAHSAISDWPESEDSNTLPH